ncbi:hypothetical protein P7C71_g2202, partial [Lecanoromycetidae sp. Uapishka_2]
MGAPRRQRQLIKSRRRVEDDGEEEGSVAAGAEEDSLSEGSVISDADDDADAEASDGDESGSPIAGAPTPQAVANGHTNRSSNPAPTDTKGKPSLPATMCDTETMMNGLKISGEVEDAGVDFEDLGAQPDVQQLQEVTPQDHSGATSSENIAERRRREHEEYKKKRDADPAFVPNHSPATLEFNPPQQQHQLPFHQQVPSQITGQAYPSEYPHSRQPSHPSQASGGTPLPQIPERAVHAQPFQPYPFQHPGGFYPQQFPPPVYYYPPPDPTTGAPSAAAPAFVPGQPYQYPMPMAPPPQQHTESTTQAGMVAHESNGMVYYYDPSQLAENTPSFPQASYPMPPPVVGMGGMMTPPIYYPPPGAYYPPQ